MPDSFAFSPNGPAVKHAVTTTGTRVALAAWSQGGGGGLMITVRGGNDVFIRWGDSSVTCDETNGHPCLARSQSVWSVPGWATHLYLIALDATTTVQISQGQGS